MLGLFFFHSFVPVFFMKMKVFNLSSQVVQKEVFKKLLKGCFSLIQLKENTNLCYSGMSVRLCLRVAKEL